VIEDPSVSGEHSTILFRDNEFLIKDNFSTNGTKINGVSTNEGLLKEGDELKLGNTVFKFKSAF
jgi:pSer/pThr/pTyr-binding forkhead associated (FHA) protein